MRNNSPASPLVERNPDKLTVKQMLIASFVLLALIAYNMQFYIVPPVIKHFLGNQAAAEFQSNYLAKSDNLSIQHSVGYHFFTGKKLVKSESLAIEWWQKAVERDVVKAKSSLAYAYLMGKGVNRDYEKANRLLDQAIMEDDSYALSLKGWCFAKGTCETKSEKKATFYFIRAAVNSKNGYAHSYLGYFYLNGIGGLEKSVDKTRFHYKLAGAQGVQAALKRLAKLDRQNNKS
jgi:TPR repeat protein